MAIPTEKLLAYLDGELPPEEMRAVETALAADPVLRRQLDQQKALSGTLQNAFTPVLSEPVPQRLLDALAQHAATAPLHQRLLSGLRAWFAHTPLLAGSATAAGAMAFGLVLGIGVVPPQSGDFASGPDGVVAKSGLATALTTQLASNQTEHAAAKIGLTFRNGKGDYCRTFQTSGTSGIACHEQQTWHIVALAASPGQTPQTAYHMAGSDMPESIRDAVTAMMSGSVLDAAAEQQARESGWAAKN